LFFASTFSNVVIQRRRFKRRFSFDEQLLLSTFLFVLFFVVFAVTLALVLRTVGRVVVEAVAEAVNVGAFDAREFADGATSDSEIETIFNIGC
jgi:hypothetical protein